MLIWSVLPPAAGVCANPIATSKAGTTISRNPPKSLALRRSAFRLGLIVLPISLSNSRPCGAPAGKPGGIQVKLHNLTAWQCDCLFETAHILERGEPRIDQTMGIIDVTRHGC